MMLSLHNSSASPSVTTLKTSTCLKMASYAAHPDLPPMCPSTGELTGVRPGSHDANTHKKKRYSNSSSIKLFYLYRHSNLREYVLRYENTDLRIGGIADKKEETFTFHDVKTGKYIATDGGMDDLANYVSGGQQLRETWNQWRVIRNEIDECSLKDFRHDWAHANGRLLPGAGAGGGEATEPMEDDESDG
jgi:hypothetical protein